MSVAEALAAIHTVADIDPDDLRDKTEALVASLTVEQLQVRSREARAVAGMGDWLDDDVVRAAEIVATALEQELERR